MSTDLRLPEGWVETTLGDILPIQYGKGLSEAIRDKDGKVPVYGSSGVVGYHNQALTSEETLILGRKGSVGSVYYSSVPCWPIDTTYFVERTTSINLKFFLHLLSSLQLMRLDKSTAIPGLNRDDYNEIKVKIPPSPEQDRIVAAIEQQFTRLDNAIASLQSAKTRVKQYYASLLKAAAEGELTKEWRTEPPAEEAGAQLLARIRVERRAHWEEEQLAKMRELGISPMDDRWKQAYKEPQRPNVEQLPTLPDGWCWVTLDELSWHITSGSRGWAQYYSNSGSLFIRVGNFNRLSTKIDLQNAVFVRAPDSLEADRCRLQIGDLLITITADVGMVGVVDEYVFQWGEAFINQHVGLVRFIYPELTTFVALALASEAMQAQIRSKQYGATKTGLGLEDIRSLVVPLSPLAEQQHICAELERCQSIVQEQEALIEVSLKRAEYERQSILREAFEGRLMPQDPGDEPASMLLERIREERKKREEAEKIVRVSRKRIHMESTKKRQVGKTSLYKSLVNARRPLPPDDLFKRAGLKRDEQPESVEVFYEELHGGENVLIRETRPDDAHVLLEALETSAEDLARMSEAEAPGQAQEAEQSQKTLDAPTLWML